MAKPVAFKKPVKTVAVPPSLKLRRGRRLMTDGGQELGDFGGRIFLVTKTKLTESANILTLQRLKIIC